MTFCYFCKKCNKRIAADRLKDAQKTVEGNKKTASVVGYITGEITEEAIKN